MKRYLESTYSQFSNRSPAKRAKEEVDSAREELYESLMDYDLLGKIGEGTFGEVFKARDKETGELFAIKIFRARFRYSYNSREIRYLEGRQHENLIEMLGVVKDYNTDRFGIVFELMNFSLHYAIRKIKTDFEENHIRWLLHQILSGVRYLHAKKIIHRDLKPSNLLLNRDGTLKIADLGCACEYVFDSPVLLNEEVFGTFCYLAPEILLGAKVYSPKIDLWSVGCIFAELVLRKRLFNGADNEEIVNHIFQILGTPTQRTWPGITSLPGMKRFENQPQHSGCLSDLFRGQQLNKEGFCLLKNLLQSNPEMRIRAVDADLDEYPDEISGVYDPSEFAKWLQSNLDDKRSRRRNSQSHRR